MADSDWAEQAQTIPQTLAEATFQAQALSGNLSHALLQQAHQAFLSGMQLTALACGLIVLGMTVLCLLNMDWLAVPIRQIDQPKTI